MRTVLLAFVIILAPAAYAADPLCHAPEPAEFLHPENAFHAPATLAKAIDFVLRAEEFEASPEAVLLKKRLGDEFETALLEVERSVGSVGMVVALSTFQAVAHFPVKTAKDFLALYRKTLPALESKTSQTPTREAPAPIPAEGEG